VVDRLDRLRLDAVVGRDHQDDDVGDLGAARAHGGERLVAGRVEEGDALIAAQLLALAIFADERRAAVRTALRGQILSHAASIVLLLKATPAGERARIVEAVSTRRLRFALSEASAVDPDDARNRDNALTRRLREMVGSDVGEVLVEIRRDEARLLEWREQREARRGARRQETTEGAAEDSDDHEHHRHEAEHRSWQRPPPPLGLKISIRIPSLDPGQDWLNVATLVPPSPPGWAWPPLVTLAVMAAAILVIVSLVARRIAGPMDRLAAAADRLGRGEDQPPLPEEGPEEVRRTTRAFNRMSQRLHRFVQDRTRMLAAISHDLRTPITTLRLRAELIDDPETSERLLATLDEMQQMVEAALAFAREEAAREATVVVDLAALVGSLCADLSDLGLDIAWREADRLAYPCRPLSLKRALRNLIENAVGYGKRARVALETTAEGIAVVIDDDGPGIPQDRQEEVFAPFVRLEESRSRETGGIGLGMAIARTVARSHGGDITLSNRPDGGLRVRLLLPPAAEPRQPG